MQRDDYPGYGMLDRHDDAGRQTMYKSCTECGSKIIVYEGKNTVCEQCGYSTMEAEMRGEYESLNEGDCGCGGCEECGDNNYDDIDNILPDEALGLGIKNRKPQSLQRFLYGKKSSI